MFRLRYFALMVLLVCLILLAGGRRAVAADPGPGVHIVTAGETLFGISQKYGVSLDQLLAANHLTDPNLIQIGQELIIPGDQAAVPAAPAPAVRARGPLLDPSHFDPALAPFAAFAPFRSIRYSAEITQGQTGIVQVTLPAGPVATGRFDDNPLRFFVRGKTRGGVVFSALIPTDALMRPGLHSLVVGAGDAQFQFGVNILPGPYETQHIVLPPSKGGLLAPKKVQSEFQRLYEYWIVATPNRLWRHRFRFPIGEGFQQTSPFGTRRSYNNGPVSGFHTGADWSAPEGVPILAPEGGVVVVAENLEVRGGSVVIDHGQGVFSSFWHLSRIDVSPGQGVAKGDTIGLVGTTGLSTGAHLHWEVRVNGVAVDPMQWTQRFALDVPTIQVR